MHHITDLESLPEMTLATLQKMRPSDFHVFEGRRPKAIVTSIGIPVERTLAVLMTYKDYMQLQLEVLRMYTTVERLLVVTQDICSIDETTA